MRIGEVIAKRKSSISFEFFPPKNEKAEDKLFRVINELAPLDPTFVSVTYGAGGGTSKNTRHVVNRILKETTLAPMPHLTCVDQNKHSLKQYWKATRNSVLKMF